MKIAFLDRDGTIINDYEDEEWRHVTEPIFIDGSLEALKEIMKKGYQIIIITNQYLINDEIITLSQYNTFIEKIIQELNRNEIKILDIFFCPHSKKENCNCFKSKTGLVDMALRKYPQIELNKSFIVGDSTCDQLSIRNLKDNIGDSVTLSLAERNRMLKIVENQLPIKIADQIMVRYISHTDKEDLFKMYSNENVSKYVARKTHTSIKDTEEFIEVINGRIKYGNNLYLGICDIDSQRLIGIIRFLNNDDPSTLTIGYALNETFWGKGIVPRVLNKLIDLIILDGDFKKLRATVRPENINSQRCLGKTGFERARRFTKSETIGDKEIESERLLYIKSL